MVRGQPGPTRRAHQRAYYQATAPIGEELTNLVYGGARTGIPSEARLVDLSKVLYRGDGRESVSRS